MVTWWLHGDQRLLFWCQCVFFYKAMNNNTQLAVWEQLPLTSLRPKTLSRSLSLNVSRPSSLASGLQTRWSRSSTAHFLFAAFTSCHLMGLPAMPLWSGPWRGSSPSPASCRTDSCGDNSCFPLCSGNFFSRCSPDSTHVLFTFFFILLMFPGSSNKHQVTQVWQKVHVDGNLILRSPWVKYLDQMYQMLNAKSVNVRVPRSSGLVLTAFKDTKQCHLIHGNEKKLLTINSLCCFFVCTRLYIFYFYFLLKY